MASKVAENQIVNLKAQRGGTKLAMVCNQDAFKRAQKEMDEVVGHERLPEFDDRKSLPYLECLIKEVYRYVNQTLFER